MQTSHELPGQTDHANALPTLTLAWVHFLIALACGISAITASIPPVLGILGMSLFAGIAMIFALLTLSHS